MRLILFLLAFAFPATAQQVIIIQSTTSTQNSGLYDHLLPLAEAETGVEARVVAVGTGQAIRNAERCDGDVLLVHAKAAEDAFVAAGYGIERHDLMFNDFVLVGPDADPAGIAATTTVAEALATISEHGAVFLSRGDDSGTHRKEQTLWRITEHFPDASRHSWYRETGAGMGATLNTAVAMEGYTLTDRASWIAFGNKADHRILFEGEASLFNQYGVIVVSPEHCSNVKILAAQALVDWLLSAEGQSAIAAFRLDGQQLFFPNARE